ncbi:hypothetical protein NVP1081O_354 [Vibrio phage 1.081.O._10N.286.52.C2]|nr:hypothetical protein NVP1081O_354 [Vibrio phage 1.081.O._10N.286.52.C2]
MAILTSDLKFNKSLHVVAASVGNGNTHDLEIDSLGGGISETELISGELHGLFDAVPSSEALSGRTEYRLIYVRNNHATQTLYDARVFITANTVSLESTMEIGLDPVAGNAEDSVILLDDEVDSGDALQAVVWAEHATFAEGLSIGNLNAGEQRAIWARRIIDAGATPTAESATFVIRGDTDA